MLYTTTPPAQSRPPSVSFFNPISPTLTAEELQQQSANLHGEMGVLKGAIKSINFFPLNYFTLTRKIIQGLEATLASVAQKKETLEKEGSTPTPEARSRLGQPQASGLDSIHSNSLEDCEHPLADVQSQINTIRSIINEIDINAGQRITFLSDKLIQLEEQRDRLASLGAQASTVHQADVIAGQKVISTISINFFNDRLKLPAVQWSQDVRSYSLFGYTTDLV